MVIIVMLLIVMSVSRVYVMYFPIRAFISFYYTLAAHIRVTPLLTFESNYVL